MAQRATERKMSPRLLRWVLALAGEAALAGSLASTTPSYRLPGILFLFVLGSVPLVVYATSLKSRAWSLLTGLALLALTLWTSVSFALVPARDRDGLEGLAFFFQLALGLALTVLGVALERLSARHTVSH